MNLQLRRICIISSIVFSFGILGSCTGGGSPVQRFPGNETDSLTQHSLMDMLEKEDFFRLNDSYAKNYKKLSRKDQLFFAGIIDNIFLQERASNQKLYLLEKKFDKDLSDKERLMVRKALRINNLNSFNYDEAFKQSKYIIENYAHLVDSGEMLDFLNEQKMLGVLRTAKVQMLLKNDAEIDIPFYYDNWNMIRTEVQFPAFSSDFLFDTGFSMSCIKRSLAEKSGYNILDVDFEVPGATGEKAICDIMVADEFSVGNLTFHHAVFWVFDDKDLELPQFDFYVNGVLGMPVIKALEEIRIDTTGVIHIPAVPGEYETKNLAFEELNPVIAVEQFNDTMPFYFDNGAAFTDFYRPYYLKHKDYIESSFRKDSAVVGSLGGTVTFYYYLADTSILEVAGKSATLRNKGIHVQYLYDDHEKVFGNLGSDFMLQFSEMTISFKSNAVIFN